MKIQTEAFLLGATDVHSNKSGKDFTKLSLVIEGGFCSFFVSKQQGDTMRKAKQFAELQKTGNPQKCVLELDIDFTERGVFTNVRGIVG